MDFKKQLYKLSFVSYFRLYLIFFSVLLVHRIAFWWAFASGNMTSHEIFKSWWLGLRFDVRMISLFFLISFGLFIILSPFFKFLRRRQGFYLFQKIWFSLGLAFFVICEWVDFGYYSYLGERLSSKIFVLLSNPSIAFGMVLQSYPVAVILLAFICLALLIYFLVAKLGFVFKEQMFFYSQPVRPLYVSGLKYFGIFLILAITIHSKISQYPLRWSQAYFSRNAFLNQFALNPLQNLFDTYKFNHSNIDPKRVEDSIINIQKELGLAVGKENNLLVRDQKLQKVLPNDMNLVVIMMESMAAFKLGHSGNPFDTSPNFDKLIQKSLYFDNFHVVQTGTAASIFCLMTGTPDLNEEETASRNPLVVDQHTMINNLKDHSKYYFIGGSANWGNIRGVIQNNIYGVKLYEEGMYKHSSLNDIWGISDYALFEEADDILKKEDKPFFAFIQTAGYHKPYTIPSRTGGFEHKELSPEQIKKYGFFSNEEYNSLRFADHSLGHFFDLAKKSDYFKNTLFVVYADHGLRSYESETLSSFYSNHKFPVYHIPLMIYSPQLPDEYKGQVNSTLGYEPDVLPTVMSMLGVPGPNSTFGVDLLSQKAKNRKGIFLRGRGAYPGKFFDGEKVVRSSLHNDKIKAYKTQDFLKQLYHHDIKTAQSFKDEELDLKNLDPSELKDVKEKAELGRSYYNAIRFKLRNNQKDRVSKAWEVLQEEKIKNIQNQASPEEQKTQDKEAKKTSFKSQKSKQPRAS